MDFATSSRASSICVLACAVAGCASREPSVEDYWTLPKGSVVHLVALNTANTGEFTELRNTNGTRVVVTKGSDGRTTIIRPGEGFGTTSGGDSYNEWIERYRSEGGAVVRTGTYSCRIGASGCTITGAKVHQK